MIRMKPTAVAERNVGAQFDQMVGILGGMGPAATNDFYQKLIAATPALRDQDHLPVVIWGDPRIPDRTEALLQGGPDPTPWIRNGIVQLRAAGCRLIAMPCNSAHAFLQRLGVAELGIELLDMISETVARVSVATPAARVVGVLGTTGTVRSGIYDHAFGSRGIRVIAPSQQEQSIVMSLIRKVKAGSHGPLDTATLMTIIDVLRDRGAEAVILGCTELPLIAGSDECTIFDPGRILAESVVAHALCSAHVDHKSTGGSRS